MQNGDRLDGLLRANGRCDCLNVCLNRVPFVRRQTAFSLQQVSISSARLLYTMSEQQGPKQSGGVSHVQDDGNGENNPRTLFQRLIGYFLLFGCVCFWQGMGMILQSIENPASDSREKPYRAFYYMTWWIHNGFLFSLLVWALTQKFHYHLDILPRLLNRHVLKMTLIGSASALVGTMMWYYSLQRTILSANNVIYQTTPLFVFLFSIKILGEKVTRNKIIAFGFFMLGIICVTIFTKSAESDSGEKQESTPLGYLLCLGATVFYAGYEVFFAWQERKAKEKEVPGTPKRNSIMDSLLFVGMMGFWNMFVLWPGIFLVEWIGLEEKFSYPSDFVAIEIVGVAACEVGMHMFLLSGIAVSKYIHIVITSFPPCPCLALTISYLFFSGYSGACIYGRWRNHDPPTGLRGRHGQRY